MDALVTDCSVDFSMVYIFIFFVLLFFELFEDVDIPEEEVDDWRTVKREDASMGD